VTDSIFANMDDQSAASRPIQPAGLSQTAPVVPLKKHKSHYPLMSEGFFQLVLGEGFISEPEQFKKRRLNFSKLQLAMLSVAALTILAGGYLSFIGWHSANVSQKQAVSLTKLANQAYANGLGVSSKKVNAPSTTPIPSSVVAAYSVAPNLPKYLIIPKLNVDARVLAVGVTSSGAVGAPEDIYDTAWYNESAEPGQPGAMLIDGHISSWTAHGVFYGLSSLKPGDTIRVERGDNTMFSYSVVKTAVYPVSNVNMEAALTPVVAGQPGLNLISCTGDVIPGTNSFNERIVVFATQISS
jgi:sortase (surface protein transpeptidase)